MTIPTCSNFGLCKLSRILAGTHSFWDCRTVLFHWLTEVKGPPFLRARNLKQRTKVSGSLALQFQHRRTVSNARLVGLPETWVLERVCRTFSGVPLAKSDTPLRFRATPRQCMRSHS